MKPRPFRRLLLRFFLFLVIGLILWIYLQPSYSRLLISVAQQSLSWVEEREKTGIKLKENMILFIPMTVVAKKDAVVGGRDIRGIHYNSAILFALILFSPGLNLRKRTWILLSGLALLFITQALTVIVQVKFFYAFQLGEYSRTHFGPWERNVYAFLKQFLELVGKFSFPFVIWMGFTYRKTIEYLTGTTPETKRQKKGKNKRRNKTPPHS